ncbi:MAG TPA: glycosyl hydrolase family 8 [Succinivibrionaceae bacterium]|nr:glycosyl hydrolase family 8 [Succinivibrionaceae bacterium]
MTIKKTLLSLILCTCVASANAGNLYSYDKYLTYHYGQGRITENAKAEDTIFAKYQAYNLFFAIVDTNKELFATLLHNFERILCMGSVDLYIPNKSSTLGQNSDTFDVGAALFTAYSLLEASEKFSEPEYKSKALKIIKCIKTNFVVKNEILGELIVSAYDKNQNLFIRPSDFPLFVVQRLSELDPDLKKLLHNSYVAIVKGAVDGFVADELQFNADGNLVIKKNTIGAADALKFYLFLNISSKADANFRLLKPLYDNMEKSLNKDLKAPLEYNFFDKVESGDGSIAYTAALMPDAKGKIKDYLRTKLKSYVFKPHDFYAHTLALFSFGYDRNCFSLAPDGRIVVKH